MLPLPVLNVPFADSVCMDHSSPLALAYHQGYFNHWLHMLQDAPSWTKNGTKTAAPSLALAMKEILAGRKKAQDVYLVGHSMGGAAATTLFSSFHDMAPAWFGTEGQLSVNPENSHLRLLTSSRNSMR